MESIDDYMLVIAIVNSGSFRKAAEQLGLHQSSVSRRIAKLENEYGFSIFESKNNKENLTEDGKKVFEFAASVLKKRNEVLEGIHNKNMLRIGHSEEKFQLFFSDLILKYKQKNKKVKVMKCDYSNIKSMLMNHEIDIFYGYYIKEYTNSEIRFLKLNEVPLLAIIGNDNPLSKKNKIVLADLSGKVISVDYKSQRAILPKVLGQKNIKVIDRDNFLDEIIIDSMLDKHITLVLDRTVRYAKLMTAKVVEIEDESIGYGIYYQRDKEVEAMNLYEFSMQHQKDNSFK